MWSGGDGGWEEPDAVRRTCDVDDCCTTAAPVPNPKVSLREFPQRSSRTDVELPVHLETGQGPATAATKNIGTGGVFLASEHPRQVGEVVTMTFELPGTTRAISVRGQVRWTRKNADLAHPKRSSGMGLRFVNPSVDTVIAIHGFLLSREPAQGGEPA
jgi:uncharacterized protein (TIGR02266 family)